MARVCHKKYKGQTLKEGRFRSEEIDGDVILDFVLSFKNRSNAPDEFVAPCFGGGIIDVPTQPDKRETQELYQGCPVVGHCQKYYTYEDTLPDLARREEIPKLLNINLGLTFPEELSDRHQYILLPYRVYGYVLHRRQWYPLDIDLIQDVNELSTDKPDGFNDLVLPEYHKNIVKALVETHARDSFLASENTVEEHPASRDMDIVKGKGQGVVILLHGVPGVGKTSTAECVAAHTNRPLFPITCGDVGGATAKDVEDNLECYFYLARRWGCVLLLDEADVFLCERLRGDIVQNSFVSVFLRVLEYYSGILILTTNRVGQFDEAIKSRLHFSLYYPPLTKKDSLDIWKMNLDRLNREADRKGANEKILFSRKEILRFAKAHWASHEANRSNWNGRQIKNAFQTAIALAEWDRLNSQSMHSPQEENFGPLLEAKHFQKVAETSARFDHYLTDVRKSDEENAKYKNNRKDDYVDLGIPNEAGVHYPDPRARKAGAKRKTSTAVIESEDSDSGDSDSDSDDEMFEVKKRTLEARRIANEKQQERKIDAEKLAKRGYREQKKKNKREEEQLKKRRELSVAQTYGSGSSD